jgi:hypothetical protein
VGRVGRIGAPKKASLDTSRNLDFDSNVTDESDLHSAKHFSPKTSTDAGTMIRIKPLLKNAFSSIRDNLDSDSNVTKQSDPQFEKQSFSKTSTDAETTNSIKSAS